MHRLLALTAAIAFGSVATAVGAQTNAVGGGMSYVQSPIKAADMDQDGRIDLGEFKRAFDTDLFFKHWDHNDDGYISKSEYVAAHFSVIDLNNDDEIAKSEWDYSGRFWLEDDYHTQFSHWDASDDGYIQQEEFQKRLDVDKAFARWDSDGTDPGLTKSDVAAGFHGAWDRDNDGHINEEERQRGPGRQG